MSRDEGRRLIGRWRMEIILIFLLLLFGGGIRSL
jgi:hypothetical protein